MTTQDRPWTTLRLLNWTTEHFTKKGIDSPRVSAEMLLAHVLESTRIKLYTEIDRIPSDLHRAAFRDLVERASKHEPVDYLIGKAPFFSLMLKVTPAVLIPRPSTETIIEHVLQHARRSPGFATPLIGDICTGSGAIAVTLAKNMPKARVMASDISPEALEIARENARDHKVSDRIEFRQADFLNAIQAEKFQFLISNPPYISDQEWADVLPNVKNYEPTLALRGGADGMKFIRPLIAEAHKHLDYPGQLLIEIAASQKDKALDLARQNHELQNPQILADHEGLPRVLIADRAPINPLVPTT